MPGRERLERETCKGRTGVTRGKPSLAPVHQGGEGDAWPPDCQRGRPQSSQYCQFSLRPQGFRTAGVDGFEGDADPGLRLCCRSLRCVKPLAPKDLGKKVAGPHLQSVGCTLTYSHYKDQECPAVELRPLHLGGEVHKTRQNP